MSLLQKPPEPQNSPVALSSSDRAALEQSRLEGAKEEIARAIIASGEADTINFGEEMVVHPAYNSLREDRPRCFDHGVCTPRILEVQGLVVSSRLIIEKLIQENGPLIKTFTNVHDGADKNDPAKFTGIHLQTLQDEGAQYVVIPYFQEKMEDGSVRGDIVRILSIDQLQQHENDLLYTSDSDAVLHKTFSTQNGGIHPLGHGGYLWTIGKKQQ